MLVVDHNENSSQMMLVFSSDNILIIVTDLLRYMNTIPLWFFI